MSSNVDAGIAETKEAWIWIVWYKAPRDTWIMKRKDHYVSNLWWQINSETEKKKHTVESSDTHFIVYKSVIIWGKTKRLKLTRIQQVVKKPLN